MTRGRQPRWLSCSCSRRFKAQSSPGRVGCGASTSRQAGRECPHHDGLHAGADSALGYRWRADKTAIERLGLTPGRSLADRQVQASIIASLALHYDRPREAGEDLGRVSYSRSTDHYDVPERYRSTPYSRKRVCAAIDGLAEAGLIVNMKALPGAHLHRDEAKRLQSACYALPAMMDRLKGLKLVDLAPRCP